MSSNVSNEVSTYFNLNWERYKDTVNKNILYHHEMFMALNQFLNEHMQGRSFSFVDVGCGDSSSIEPVLVDKSIKKYIGIDAADDVLKLAASTLAHFNCDKEFICDNMTTAIKRLNSTVDIIFTSYAVHHLSTQEKIDFITDCKSKLTENGFLLMIDGVLEENQTRDEWLKALEDRYKITSPEITQDELNSRMEHPNASDHPEEIKTFESIAKKLSWNNFQVLVNKEIFAFMVFSK